MLKNYIYKIIAAGDGGVGKTTLLKRYVEGKFSVETKLTVGVEFFSKELDINGNHFALQLWDFGGQDRFRFMLDGYIIGAKGALLMFDLTRMDTLNNLQKWVNLLRKQNVGLPLLFVGTKLDLIDNQNIDNDYIKELTKKYNFFDFIKVSSKTGENVKETFEKIISAIMRYK